MRAAWKGISLLLLLAMASPALAGITVTEYQTVAHTNAYAPLSQKQYFEQQVLTNVSPAVAEVSGDWMGTNTGGSTITWHWVGSAQTTSTTVFDANNLTVTGAGSFAHELTTTAEFVDPRSSMVFTPASAADYQCFFTLDEPATYSIRVELGMTSKVLLGSIETGFIFNEINVGATPRLVQLSGSIPPGHYEIRANASIGAPNFPNGANHYTRNGSFDGLSFTVEVPEPAGVGALIVGIAATMCGRRRSCAGIR